MNTTNTIIPRKLRCSIHSIHSRPLPARSGSFEEKTDFDIDNARETVYIPQKVL